MIPFISFPFIFGTLIVGGLTALVIGVLSRSHQKAYERGKEEGKREQEAVIYEQAKQLLAEKIRTPQIGGYEYVADFDVPRSLTFARVIDVGKDNFVVYIKQGDLFPLTGRFERVSLILPDSAQEC